MLLFKLYPVMDLLALASRKSFCFLGGRINQLMGFFVLLRIAGSECPYGPLKPRPANRTTVYWTCVLWPAASRNCQMVWKTSPISCYPTSGINGWLFINLRQWKVNFCFSKTVVMNILCKLKWFLKIFYSRKVEWSCWVLIIGFIVDIIIPWNHFLKFLWYS